jgi:hypothetical protein
LGKIIFSPTLTTTGGSFVGFAWIGIFLMHCIYQMGRVSHHNPLYVSPPHNTVDISSIIHPQNMRFKEFHVASNLESEETQKQMLAVQDEIVELNRRRNIIFVGLFFFIVLISSGNFFIFFSEEKQKTLQKRFFEKFWSKKI